MEYFTGMMRYVSTTHRSKHGYLQQTVYFYFNV